MHARNPRNNLTVICALLSAIALAGCDATSTTSGIAVEPAGSNWPPGYSIFLDQGPERDQQRIVVRGSGAAEQNELAKANLTGQPSERLQQLLRIVVVTDGVAGNVPMLGEYTQSNEQLIFEPRFPLQRGLKYRAIFDPAKLSPTAATAPEVAFDFSLPKPPESEASVVRAVYPSARKLPENLLKFYIAFSAPMSRGEAYKRVHLLRSDGSDVELPFLELAEELWDPAATRLTLLFDPGRIKQGLKPREEVGPALEAGKSYTLVIDRDWIDSSGNPLGDGFRKSFDVAAPDSMQPNVDNWKLTSPAGDTRNPLIVQFPEPLDRAMLERVLTIKDAADHAVEGIIEIDQDETRWQFCPTSAWSPATYHLAIDSSLEDLAGNSIAHPFEVDLQQKAKREPTTKTVKRPFEVSASAAAQK